MHNNNNMNVIKLEGFHYLSEHR